MVRHELLTCPSYPVMSVIFYFFRIFYSMVNTDVH